MDTVIKIFAIVAVTWFPLSVWRVTDDPHYLRQGGPNGSLCHKISVLAVLLSFWMCIASPWAWMKEEYKNNFFIMTWYGGWVVMVYNVFHGWWEYVTHRSKQPRVTSSGHPQDPPTME